MKKDKNTLTSNDIQYLERCLTLAEDAVKAGDQAFGSILVNDAGAIIAEARNRVNEETALSHPEYELAQWAAKNLSEEERIQTTMYTTGEHCPMCSAAHGWVNLGTIVYLSSGKQLNEWLQEIDAPPSPINFVATEEIIKKIEIRGPGSGELLQKIKDLHIEYYKKQRK